MYKKFTCYYVYSNVCSINTNNVQNYNNSVYVLFKYIFF